MYFIGLDVHKKSISFCVKDAAGRVYQAGKVAATRRDLAGWVRTLPEPRMMAMESTIFTGWIYDFLLPHAETVKVAHPLMLRAIAAAKKKNDKIDARMPYGFDRDPRSAPRAALPQPGGEADGADEEPGVRPAAGNRRELQQAEAA
jgi:hypothetical protein